MPCPATLLWFNGATAALEAFPKAAAPPPPPPEDTPSGNTIKLPSMVAALLHIVGSGPYETRAICCSPSLPPHCARASAMPISSRLASTQGTLDAVSMSTARKMVAVPTSNDRSNRRARR